MVIYGNLEPSLSNIIYILFRKEGNMIEHQCDICGRKQKNKIKAFGYILCNKHYNQLKKYGKFLDNNPRTPFDKNEYHIQGDTTVIDLYDKNCNKIAEVIIDTEDLPKIKNIKWKLSNSGYAMNTPKYKGHNLHMTHIILGTDNFVDHINHNKLDNRKSNLRIVTKSQNQMNVNYLGVYQCGNKWVAKIKLNQKQLNLGHYSTKIEALFARWYAEQILFKEYAYPKEKPCLSNEREQDIMNYVDKKVQRL